MPRPTYTVFTLVTCSLVFVGAAVIALKPLVPKASMNSLGRSREEFLLQGEFEPVHWYTYPGDASEEDPFVVSKKTGKPVLLYIGAPWSSLARSIDTDAFVDSTVERILSRDYVCIRIDGMRHPDWLNALEPVTRLNTRFSPGMQIWILDPKGRNFLLLAQTQDAQSFDHNAMVDLLVRARNLYNTISNEELPLDQQPGHEQISDINGITIANAVDSPDLTSCEYNLSRQISSNPQFGGFLLGGIQALAPNASRFLLLSGDWQNFRASVDPILTSPMDDILDGGFFRIGLFGDVRRVRFDKITTTNAEMMVLLADASAVCRSRHLDVVAQCYEEVARRTWSFLTDEMYKDGIFATCRVGDEGPDERSPHSSFSPSVLRSALSTDDRAWAQDKLGLRPFVNPVMTPYPTDLSVLSSDLPRLHAVLKDLGAIPRAAPHLAGLGQLAPCAFTVARLLETARLWNDPDAYDFASDASDALQSFRNPELENPVSAFDPGDEISEAVALRPDAFGVVTTSTLPDYLSYSDAMLQTYLMTGRIPPLEDGLKALRVAIKKFAPLPGSIYGDVPPRGVYLMSEHQDIVNVANADVPEIADNTCESASAQLIRLCLSYGRLLNDTRIGRELVHTAYDVIGRFSGVAGAGSPLSGAYYCSALSGVDDRYAIAVGNHAQELADDLYRRVPTRFVAPAFGEVRPDLQGLKPGIYVLRGSARKGPLTVDQAVGFLPADFARDPAEISALMESVPNKTSH